MNIVLFEDPYVEQLHPITVTRPAFTVTCGAWRLLDLVVLLAGEHHLSCRVRPYLQDFADEYFPTGHSSHSSNLGSPREKTLWLNSRLVPAASLLRTLEQVVHSDGSLQALVDGQIALAVTPAGVEWDGRSPLRCEESIELDAHLFEHPHDVVVQHAEVIADQLRWLAQSGDYREIQKDVLVRGESNIAKQVVWDTSSGPIVLEEGVNVEPFTVIRGPARIGHATSISPQSHLKGPISIGHHCKVGGEVSRSVIEPYSNKVHYGYLGSSYVGSWVNLGAGTSNSNLKNTYGTVRVEYESQKIDTGLQFFGCVIGDYTKTAINTSIFTGKILGVCSNVYGFVTTNVPSFANYARSFGEVTEQPAEVMEVTQKRVFERRGIQQGERHTRLLQEIYRIEASKRELANHPPSL